MKRILIIAALVVTALVPSAAAAAPVEQCTRGATTQFDMAGTYRSSTMYVEIFPCGGIYLEWTNAYGTHAASYGTGDHASDGVIATLTSGDGLDNQPNMAVKAAEPGYVQVWTIDDSYNVVHAYRLRKTS